MLHGQSGIIIYCKISKQTLSITKQNISWNTLNKTKQKKFCTTRLKWNFFCVVWEKHDFNLKTVLKSK